MIILLVNSNLYSPHNINLLVINFLCVARSSCLHSDNNTIFRQHSVYFRPSPIPATRTITRTVTTVIPSPSKKWSTGWCVSDDESYGNFNRRPNHEFRNRHRSVESYNSAYGGRDDNAIKDYFNPLEGEWRRLKTGVRSQTSQARKRKRPSAVHRSCGRAVPLLSPTGRGDLRAYGKHPVSLGRAVAELPHALRDVVIGFRGVDALIYQGLTRLFIGKASSGYLRSCQQLAGGLVVECVYARAILRFEILCDCFPGETGQQRGSDVTTQSHRLPQSWLPLRPVAAVIAHRLPTWRRPLRCEPPRRVRCPFARAYARCKRRSATKALDPLSWHRPPYRRQTNAASLCSSAGAYGNCSRAVDCFRK